MRWCGTRWLVAVWLVLMSVGVGEARYGSGRRHYKYVEVACARPHARNHFGRRSRPGRHRPVVAASPFRGLHPVAQARLSAALGEMHRHGLRPHLTSVFRSTSQQRRIFHCARSRRCRMARGIYGARPPGSSTHEAGLAVDIAGIATRGRGRRRHVTRPGAAIVRIMRHHDFAWRYGLRDPAHFELNPARAGFRTTRAAIVARQRVMAMARPRVARRMVRQVASKRGRAVVLASVPKRQQREVAVILRRSVTPSLMAKRTR